MKEKKAKPKKPKVADKFLYDDIFKESLINQLWHMVYEVKKVGNQIDELKQILLTAIHNTKL